MTYAHFLFFFLIIPIIVLCLLLRRRLFDRRYWSTTALLFIPVLVCMAPWDHTAVALGIWSWAPQQTWPGRIWLIPLEEYLFSLLQTLLTTLALYASLVWWQARHNPVAEGSL